MEQQAGVTMQRFVHTPAGRVVVRVLITLLVVQPMWEISQRYQWDPNALRHLVTGLLQGGVRFIQPRAAQAAAAGTSVAAFGPKDYVRRTGKPVVVTDTFSVTDLTATYTLRIENGGQQGQYARVSSAVVTFNGVVVVAPNAFNQQVAVIEKPVVLAGQNTLSVELRSRPGSGLTLHILGVLANRAPVADAGPDRHVITGTRVTLDGSASADPDHDLLAFTWRFQSVPVQSTVTDAQLANRTTAAPSFTPDVDGTYALELTVSDGALQDTDEVLVQARPPNVPPNADAGPDQNVEIGMLVLLDGTASTDPDHGPQPLTFLWTFLSKPADSALTEADIGGATTAHATFTPDVVGHYRLSLDVFDGQATNQDTTLVRVLPPNVPPNADAGPDVLVPLGEPVALDGTRSYDPDNGPQPLTFQWTFVDKPTGSALTNTDLHNADTARPGFMPDVAGIYVLRLDVSDGDRSAFDQMMVKVNGAPVAVADTFMVDQDTTLSVPAPGVLGNDTDVNSDPLTATLVSPVSNGTLTLNANGSFTYTPPAGFHGTARFIYQANDGTASSNEAEVTITVKQVPRPVAVDDAYTTDEDRVLVMAAPGVLANDTNAGGTSTLTAMQVGDVTSGTGTLRFQPNGSFVFTPAPDFNGRATFTYRVNDGKLDSLNVATVTITVNPVNDRPRIVSTPVTTATDKQLYTYDVKATDPEANDTLTFTLPQARAGMAINATTGRITWKPQTTQVGPNPVTVRVEDAAGGFDTQHFTIDVVTTNAVPGIAAGSNQTVAEGSSMSLAPARFTDTDSNDTHTATINWGDGTVEAGSVTQSMGAGTVAGAHVYTDDGTFTVEVCVTDNDGARGCGTLMVTVTNVAPTVVAGPAQVANVGAAVRLAPSTFTDPGRRDVHTAVINWGDGTVQAGAVTQGPGSGTVAGSHVYTARGSFTPQICVQDGRGAHCDTFTVQVNGPPAITSAPVTTAAEQQAYTYAVQATDPDPNDRLTFALTMAPAGMSIAAATGVIQWTPTRAQVGDHAVTVRVQDTGGLFATQTFTITVARVLNPPQLTPIADQVMNEGTTLTVSITAMDPDGEPLTLSVSGLHPFGTFTDNGNGTGSLTFTPGFDAAGTYPLTVTASDGRQSSADDFTLTVKSINGPPVITSTPVTTARQGRSYSYQVEVTDPDLDDHLTFALETAPVGMAIDAATGLIQWLPTATQVGNHEVTVRVADAGGLFATQRFTLSVSLCDTIMVGGRPYLMALTPDGRRLYVVDSPPESPNAAGSVVVVDTATNMIVTRIPLDVGFPIGIAITPDGSTAYVGVSKAGGSTITTGMNLVDVIALSTNTIVATIPTGNGALGISEPVITPDGSRVYATDRLANLVYVIDTASNTLVMSIGVAGEPLGITITPDGSRVYTVSRRNNMVSVIHTGTNNVVATIPVGLGPNPAGGLTSIAMTPDGHRAYVTYSSSSQIAVIDTAPSSPTFNQQVAILSTTGGALIEISVSSDGRRAFVISSASAEMLIIDTDPTSPAFHTQIGSVPVGKAPQDVVFQDLPVAAAYVSNFEDGTISVICGPVERAPFITSFPLTSAIQGQLYSYDVNAIDADPGDLLTFTLDVAPVGMTIDAISGLIAWTPDASQVGDHAVAVRVEDPLGLSALQSFTIVVPPPEVPECITPPAGLIGWWSGDGQAADIVDVNHGALQHGATFAPGMVGQAFSLDGVDDVVRIPESGMQLDGFSQLTLDAWIKPGTTTSPASHGIVTKYDSRTANGVSYFLSIDNGKLRMGVCESCGQFANPNKGAVMASTNPVIPTGVFTHVAGVWQGGTQFALYVNGIQVPGMVEVIGVPPAMMADNNVPVNIGRFESFSGSFVGPGGHFDGLIDEVEISNRALSASDIRAIFDAGMAGKCKPDSHAPVITSAPVTMAAIGEPYRYDVEAIDPDAGDILTFSLLPVAPVAMTIDPTTGLIQWTPAAAQVGDHVVVVQVQDATGLVGRQRFTLTVQPLNVLVPDVVGLTRSDAEAALTAAQLTVGTITQANSATIAAGRVLSQTPAAGERVDPGIAVALVLSLGPAFDHPPAITSAPVTMATQNQVYTYDVEATDPDLALGDALTFALALNPAGMTIDSATGLIRWTPNASQVGAHAVSVRVVDSGGLFATQSFTLSVANVNDPPSFISTPVTVGTQGQLYTYVILLADSDPGDLLRVSLQEVPTGMGVNPTTGQVQWTPTATQVGDHRVTLRVEDQAGLFTLQHFTISVANRNDAPAIISTPLLTATVGQPYSYRVEATDLDLPLGDVLTFALAAPLAGMTIDASTGLIQWTPAAAQVGDNAVTVRVQDTTGLFDTQNFTITVVTPNDAPVADAGPDQTARVGDTVLLNGSGSSDVNGDRLTFAWALRTRPFGSAATLTGTTTVRPTLRLDKPGTYAVELIVDDGRDASAPDRVTISTVNSPPVAHAGLDRTVAVEELVQLDGSGSTDVDGNRLTLTWTVRTRPPDSEAVLADATALRPTFVVDVPGTYEVELMVNDGTVDSDPAVVTISTKNSRPVADAGPDQTVGVRQTVHLDGSGSRDADGEPLTRRWAFISVPEGSTASLSDASAITPTFVADVAGTYVVQLLVDDSQEVSLPDTVTISTERSPPAAKAGPDQAVRVDTTVHLDGTASSDPDHDPLTARWSFLVLPAGSRATLSAPTAISPSFVADVEGLYVVQLIVNDSTEDSPPDTVVISAAVPRVTVPNVQGLAQSNAIDAILAAGLTVGTIRPANSTTVPKGTVISQSPAAGTTVGEGAPVDLVVSIGTDAPVLVSIALTPGDQHVPRGATQPYTATGTLSNGTTQDLTAQVTWTSTNARVAPIDATGQATALQLGTTTIRATRGGITASTSLTVVAATLVSIEVTPGAPLLLTGETQRFTAIGVLTDGTRADLTGQVTWSSSLPAVATITNSGDATGLTAGTATISATTNGTTGTATLSVQARVAGDTTPPTVSMTAPEPLAELISPTDIVGTANDANLLQYELSLARVSDGTFIPFASGTTPVTNGVLGRLDTTLLENGMYRVRLTARDRNGQTASTETEVRIDGQAKVGVFTLSFTDLTIPVAGIPITITRTYDSRVKTQRDFGVGWTLEISRGFYQNNRLPGEGWRIDPGILPCQRITETLSHVTEIRLSDQEFYRFRPTLSVSGTTIGGCFATVGFAFVDGTRPGATLQILGNTQVFSQTGFSQLLDSETFAVFNPQQVRLTTVNGVIFDLDQVAGTFRLQDRNGNALSITSSGVVHSSGKSITFVRDVHGRITHITDPLDHTLEYVYDTAGDLVTFFDRERNGTTFSYDAHHNLLEIRDPLGRAALRSEYDEDGRLIKTLDVQGNATELTHDLANAVDVVKNALDSISVFEYDKRGNVIRAVDALGHETLRTYDADDNLLSETDPLGHTTTYTYDAHHNRTSVTDPLGNIIRFTYDASGNLLTQTDPLGHTTTRAYDVRGSRLSTTDALGHTTTFTNDAAGNRLSKVDPLRNVTTFAHNPSGNIIRTTNPSGVSHDFTYDASGNQTSVSYISGNRLVTGRAVFNAAGRLVRTINPRGKESLTAYDAVGNPIAVTSELGDTLVNVYDAYSRIIESRFADGTLARRVYDALGRETYTVDRYSPTDGPPRGTHMLYDQAGRVVGAERLADVVIDIVTRPNGSPASVLVSTGVVLSAVSLIYDAAGRVIETNGPAGQKRRFEYDAAGRQTATIDVLGNRTEFAYDAAGRRSLVRDALGRDIRFEYDPEGRLVKTIFPDGTFTRTVYDALGRTVAKTDQANKTYQFEYDALGHLTAVTLPAVDDPESGGAPVAPRYEYEHDPFGNLLMIRDPKGRETTFTYDEGNRLVSRTLPDDQAESLEYDAFGRISRRTDFKGQVTEFLYDALGRLSKKRLFATVAQATSGAPEVTISITYDKLGRQGTIADPRRGLTDGDYDADGNITRISSPEGVIHYDYDPATDRQTRVFTDFSDVRYTYDELSRLQTVETHKRNGIALDTPEVTQYGYTAVGSRAFVQLPNGTKTTYEYDGLNRLTRLTNTDADGNLLARYAYTLAADGRRTGVLETRLEEDGSLSQTQITYTYDALNRLIREESVDLTGARPEVNFATAYTYDLVGNRLRMTTANASGTETITYTYNGNDQLIQEVSSAGTVSTYTYDANGSLLEKRVDGQVIARYTYNLENRLESATVFSTRGNAQNVVTTTTYLYDQAGNRVRAETSTRVNSGPPTVTVQVFLLDTYNPTGFAQVYEERDAAQHPLITYTIGDDVIAQGLTGAAGSEVLYFMYDGHGSTRLLMNKAGVITDRYDYDAYGVALNFDPFRAATRLLYTGEQFDANIGQYYLRARYYDQTVGRFNRLDPFFGDTFDPLSLHKYAYGRGDSVNNIDPSGQFSLLEVVAAVAIIATVTTFVVQAVEVVNAIRGLVALTDVAEMLAEAPLDPVLKVVMGNQLARFAVQAVGRVGSATANLAETVILQVAVGGIVKALLHTASGAYASYITAQTGKNTLGFSPIGNFASITPPPQAVVIKSAITLAQKRGMRILFSSDDLYIVTGSNGTISVVAHGTPKALAGLSPKALADLIRARGIRPTGVELISCNTACGTFAPRLAAELGVPVRGALGEVGVLEAGFEGIPLVLRNGRFVLPEEGFVTFGLKP